MVERQTTRFGRADSSAAHRADHAPSLRIAGLRIEFGGRQDERRFGAGEGPCERSLILHIGYGDLATTRPPVLALGSIANDSANPQSCFQQGISERAADLAGDSRDCVHEMSPFLDAESAVGAVPAFESV
jgi:hypothetical protein